MTDSAEAPPAPPNPVTGGSLMHDLSVRFGGFSRRMAGTRWFPLWGVLRHVGRKSGTAYEIPIVALPTAAGFMIPLPFGEGTQWFKNLRASERAGLRHAGHDYVIDQPELVDRAAAGPELPAWVRFAAERVGIANFVRVRRLADR